MHEETDQPEEIKLLLRDLSQAAKTMLDVGASMEYAVVMFRLQMRREALNRTRSGTSRCHAARILGEHRNTFTRGLRDVALPRPVQSVRVHDFGEGQRKLI